MRDLCTTLRNAKYEGQTYTFYKPPLNALRALAVAACQSLVWRSGGKSSSAKGQGADGPAIWTEYTAPPPGLHGVNHVFVGYYFNPQISQIIFYP